jgi:hypothetical protein
MSLLGFERETLLDLTVNVIPMAIIVFFIVGFGVVPAFGVDPVLTTVQYSLLVVPLVALAALTYYAGKVIERDEAGHEEPVDAASE